MKSLNHDIFQKQALDEYVKRPDAWYPTSCLIISWIINIGEKHSINHTLKFLLGSTATQDLIDPLSSHSILSILRELSISSIFFFLLIFSENRMKDLPRREQNILSSFYPLICLCLYVHPGILSLFEEWAPYVLSFIFSLICGLCTSISPFYWAQQWAHNSKILKLQFISIDLFYKFTCIVFLQSQL